MTRAVDVASLPPTLIQSGGNVGIGTSSPVRKLHVSGGDFQVDYNYTVSGTSFRFLNSATPSDGVTLAADYYGSGSYGPMKFFTSNTERMRISSSGTVGINTTSMGAKLHVVDAGTTSAITNISTLGGIRVDGSIPNTSIVGLTSNPGSGGGVGFGFGRGSSWDTYLAFYTNSATNSGAGSVIERARLDANGNFGIGMIPNGNYILQTSTDGGKGGNINTFAMGKSGGDYAWAGYNFVPTSSSGVYSYNSSDYAAAIRYGQAGAIQVFTASSGTSGTTISWASGPYVALSGTSWTSSSDERLKNITGLITDALPKVSQLRAAKFTWKHDSTNKPQVGLIAQDVLKVLPEAVDTATDPDAFGVSYTEVIPLLVAAIQELTAKVESLEKEISVLKSI